MLYLLKRHFFPVKAYFEHVLVLTYAIPKEFLIPLLPPGLTLDIYRDYGFLAIAMVQTKSLRPSFMPRIFGKDFFLTGYRIFSRLKTSAGKDLRGLKILRSDTDQSSMVFWGNRLTHYHYQKADVDWTISDNSLEIKIQTPGARADLHVVADLSSCPAPLPPHSPFPDLETARQYAGPLPFTFDYEPQTHSIIIVKGLRQNWKPQPIAVKVLKAAFLEHFPFPSNQAVLANAFYISGIPYSWEKGVRESIVGKGV